jgi:hypothetical protein
LKWQTLQVLDNRGLQNFVAEELTLQLRGSIQAASKLNSMYCARLPRGHKSDLQSLLSKINFLSLARLSYQEAQSFGQKKLAIQAKKKPKNDGIN